MAQMRMKVAVVSEGLEMLKAWRDYGCIVVGLVDTGSVTVAVEALFSVCSLQGFFPLQAHLAVFSMLV